MVLSFVKQMLAAGHNLAERLWVQCIDVDRLAALMCYVQLSLWHVPAEIIVGNTLSLEFRERWYTPAHILGNWTYKLHRQAEEQTVKRESEPEVEHKNMKKPSDDIGAPSSSTGKPIQFDFGF